MTEPSRPTTSLFEAYATDAALEENGAPVLLANGSTFFVRSESSLAARRWLTARAKAQRHLIAANKGFLPPEVSDQNDIDELAEVLVTGWKDVPDGQGGWVGYTRATCRDLVTQLPALRRDLMSAARSQDQYRAVLAEEMAGNSPAPSGPSSE